MMLLLMMMAMMMMGMALANYLLVRGARDSERLLQVSRCVYVEEMEREREVTLLTARKERKSFRPELRTAFPASRDCSN